MGAKRRQRRRDEAKQEQWRRIVRDWRRSGLSVREFCDWQGLSEPSFYAWRRELELRDREAAAATSSTAAEAGSPRAITKRSTPDRMPAFLPVRVVADSVADATESLVQTDGIEVHLPTGVRLLIPPGCDRALLRDVIACCVESARETRSC
jgi:hypothetical protein